LLVQRTLTKMGYLENGKLERAMPWGLQSCACDDYDIHKSPAHIERCREMEKEWRVQRPPVG